MTEAERIVNLFENAPKTVSMLALALSAGATATNNGQIRVYSFADGSRIRVYGRGRSHQYVIDHTSLKESPRMTRQMLLVELRHILVEFNRGYIFRLDRVPEPLRDVPIFQAIDFAEADLPLVYVTEGEAKAALRSADAKREVGTPFNVSVRTTSLRRLLGER